MWNFLFFVALIEKKGKKKKNCEKPLKKKTSGFLGFPYFTVFDIYNSVCGFIQFYVDPQMLK